MKSTSPFSHDTLEFNKAWHMALPVSSVPRPTLSPHEGGIEQTCGSVEVQGHPAPVSFQVPCLPPRVGTLPTVPKRGGLEGLTGPAPSSATSSATNKPGLVGGKGKAVISGKSHRYVVIRDSCASSTFSDKKLAIWQIAEKLPGIRCMGPFPS